MVKPGRFSKPTKGYAREEYRKAKTLGELVPVEPMSRRSDGSPVAGPGKAYVTKAGQKYHPAWCEVVGNKWDQDPKGLFVIALDTVRGRESCKTCEVAPLQVGAVELHFHGEPCDPRNALRALKSAAVRAGLPGIGLHTPRHSAATVMIENGVPLKVVSEILGHFSVSITGDIYGHVSPDVSAQAMDALGTALNGVMVVENGGQTVA